MLGWSAVNRPAPRHTIASANSRKGFHSPSCMTIPAPITEARASEMTVGKYLTPLASGVTPRTAWNQIVSQYTIVLERSVHEDRAEKMSEVFLFLHSLGGINAVPCRYICHE